MTSKSFCVFYWCNWVVFLASFPQISNYMSRQLFSDWVKQFPRIFFLFCIRTEFRFKCLEKYCVTLQALRFYVLRWHVQINIKIIKIDFYVSVAFAFLSIIFSLFFVRKWQKEIALNFTLFLLISSEILHPPTLLDNLRKNVKINFKAIRFKNAVKIWEFIIQQN